MLTPHQLANVIHEAAYHERFDLRETVEAIERANGRHNLGTLHKALGLHLAGSAGTKSGNEDAFLTLLQLAGIPEPRVNTHVLGFEADFHWPEKRLVVEVDGPGHERPSAKRTDARRDRERRAAGYPVLRFTDVELEQRPADVLARLLGCL